MFKNLDEAVKFAELNGGGCIIQEKTRPEIYEIAEEDEADYLINFLKTHMLVLKVS